MLLSGRAKVSIDTEEGREVVLTFCGPGHLIGEFAVIDSEARSGTTEALEPIEALALSGPDFLALLSSGPGSPSRCCATSSAASATPTGSGSSSPPRRRSGGSRRG